MPDTTLTSAELDEAEIMEVIRKCFPWKDHGRLFDALTYEKSSPMFPQATVTRPNYLAEAFVREIGARILARAGLEAVKDEESMRERAALEAEGIGEAYGMDETGWAECSETIATAIRALPLTGGDKP